ncbi:peptidylprolyl isomerase [Novosphingobium sp. PASSN1]|uniref:peptidylprolyl isomerase n=1 Tax=Novosphingobium sp. PASSN1 TaxID=2015561 RepID=UPI000BC50CD5|nr:peptidylprolyl isomerase [Novosphingobium sp. PASSN1]OYU33386.1 MAG: peptidylprolyl isomerase [Novosphingobium sp. PASSN1]
MKHPLLLSAALLASCSAAPTSAPTSTLAPTEIIAAAPASDWAPIAASDLLVMDIGPEIASQRVVVQLLPVPFSAGWTSNMRKLAAAHWWDGTSINRVQDGYVVQWGDPDGEDKAKAKLLPPGLKVMTDAEYTTASGSPELTAALPKIEQGSHVTYAKDSYASKVEFRGGWPLASDAAAIWPIHCYGTVGVGRDYPPDTGSGAELYAVIGQAPRQLDRNIAVVGRVIEGMEYLSSLPRGTGDIGFYKTAEERTPILSIRMGSDVPDLPRYQYLSTESKSFAAYADARANRRDAFYIRPAGGVDICNVPVPVRRAK